MDGNENKLDKFAGMQNYKNNTHETYFLMIRARMF
jgi:hypothetical protein